MKKYAVIAVIGLVSMFLVSCITTEKKGRTCECAQTQYGNPILDLFWFGRDGNRLCLRGQ